MSEWLMGEVRPVTPQRVRAALHGQGYRVTEVSDAVVAGNWDGNAFTIALVGPNVDVLQVRGSWHDELGRDLEDGLGQMLNDWNRDRIWPKVYTREGTDGLRVHAEACFDLRDGVTDAQLDEVLACGLGTGVQFFEAVGEVLGG